MTTEHSIDIHPNELVQIVQSVFETMLRLEVSESGLPWFPQGDRLTAAVHLAGDWNGAVLLEVDRALARRLAARFLPANPQAILDDVVRDVLGEMANMIGGNLKCVLTSGICLSMPSVVDGSDYSMRVCGAQVRERLSFECAEGPFWVTILTTRPPGSEPILPGVRGKR